MLKPTLCPEQTAKALLEAEPAQNLPPVSLVVSCPLLVEQDGEPIVLTRGWHPAANGTLVSAGETLDLPNLDDAVSLLHELIDEFMFPSNGDRARALALLVTVALRAGGLLSRSVPLFTVEADASQTGKGYLTKIVGAMFCQRLAIVGQRNGGVGSLDESISQRLIEGRPLIVLDNFRGRLDSPFLEALLTAEGLVPARVPHRAEMQVDARRMTLLATSNGFIATPDLANRLALIRLRKQPPDHQFKRWPEGDLLSHVEENQPQYLGAVYAIVAEWIRRGKPRTDENRHSFREWSQPLDWICRNLLGVGPLLDGHMEAAERTSNPARAWLRELALHVIEVGRDGENLSASSIREICEEVDLPPPGARPDWQGAEKTVGLVMGRLFKAAGGDVLDADVATVTRSERSEPTPSGTNRTMKLYTFDRSEEIKPSIHTLGKRVDFHACSTPWLPRLLCFGAWCGYGP
jgi:hypothetical protein